MTGKAALVTGASRGIGRAVALALAGAGADVACVARTAPALDETAAAIGALGRRAVTVPADVTSGEHVERMVRRTVDAFGRLDILVNNAGVVFGRAAETLDVAVWRGLLVVDLSGAFLCAQAAGRQMIAQRSGRIINIGSIFGELGTQGFAAYAAAKAGLHSLTRSLAYEWARYGITVNCIAPGYIRTDFNRPALANPETRDRILSRIPLGRVAEPEEVGPLAVYLASDASAFMTGQVLFLDGGQAMGW
ncbi:MAG: glucose 1-dehydrogenase [Candidatus Rokubacteria bacterium]|nr:glucose 1-dehydrogenase [Candidatus Rokubacteria bacterium]